MSHARVAGKERVKLGKLIAQLVRKEKLNDVALTERLRGADFNYDVTKSVVVALRRAAGVPSPCGPGRPRTAAPKPVAVVVKAAKVAAPPVAKAAPVVKPVKVAKAAKAAPKPAPKAVGASIEQDAEKAMRAHWDAEVAKGNSPTGAELAQVGRVSASTGRARRRQWAAMAGRDLVSA